MKRINGGESSGGRPPRVADVASAAGVSMGTVSNVLNNPARVSPATRTRVEAAIASLGYVRNAAARSLAAGRSSTVGFVVVDLSNSFFLDMVRGAEAVLGPAGLTVLLANADSDADKQRTYLTLFEGEQVAGMLLAPKVGPLEGLAEIRGRGTPVVLVNAHTPADESGICAVETDNLRGGYLAAQHLLRLGRRRLLFAGSDRFPVVVDRLNGARAAVAEVAGATLDVRLTDDVRVEDGRAVGEWLTSLPDEGLPDGVLAGADLLAMGVVQAILLGRRHRIPDDIAIVGYDNNQAAWNSVVPITTVDQSGEEVGRSAAALLVAELQDPDNHVHLRRMVEPVLVPKASTFGAPLPGQV